MKSHFKRSVQQRPVITNPDLIRHYLLIEQTALRPADAIIVFGNRHSIDQAVEKAVDLYQRGMARIIVASGGNPTNNALLEGDEIGHKLLQAGIDYRDVLVDNQSTNTPENVAFSRKLLEENNRMMISSVIGIGTVVAGRRFLMTLAQSWPEVLPMVANVNPFNASITEWHLHDQFCQTALREYQKIPHYLEKGDICEVDIPALNRRIAAFGQHLNNANRYNVANNNFNL